MQRIFLLTALFYLAYTATAQPTENTTIQPDCYIPIALTAAGNSPSANVANAQNDNRTRGCAAWTLRYQNSGMTSVTVTLQSGCSTSTTVSYGSFAGVIPTTPAGNANPIVSDTGGSLQVTNGTACISWVRVNVVATGTGTLTGALYGLRNSSAAVNTSPGALPAGSVCADQLYGTSTSFAADPSNLCYIISTTAPAAPAVSVVNCSASTTAYSYSVAFHYPMGDSATSADTSIMCGATLSAMNYPVITAPTCTNGIESVDIFLSASAGIPADTGPIQRVACGATYNHQGQTGSGLVPSTDHTPGQYVGNSVAIGVDTPFIPFFGANNGAPNLKIGQTARSGMNIYGSTATAANGAAINLIMYEGTSSNPQALQNGDPLGGIDIYGYDGLRWELTPFIVQAYVDGIVTPGMGIPTSVYFTAQDPAGNAQDFILKSNGEVHYDLNGFAGGFTLTASGIWEFNNGTSGILAEGDFALVKSAYQSLDGTAGTTGNGFKNGICVTASGACVGGGVASGSAAAFSSLTVSGLTTWGTVAFAALGTPANGSVYNCSDCTVTSGINDTCIASGSGATAQRINGAWRCNQ